MFCLESRRERREACFLLERVMRSSVWGIVGGSVGYVRSIGFYCICDFIIRYVIFEFFGRLWDGRFIFRVCGVFFCF